MRRHLVLAVLLLASTATALAGQSPEERIRAAESRAAAAGIPVSLLQSRVAEGRAKGVPMERIAAAVERRSASLLEARQAMGRGTASLGAADLNAGADAVEAGIDGETLRSVIEGARAEDRPVAIAVLTYLHKDRGLPVPEALGQVKRALRDGPDALRTLPAQARGRGVPGQGAAGAARRGGPPEGVPAAGKRPTSGKPDGVGNRGGRGGKPTGTPGGGRPGGN